MNEFEIILAKLFIKELAERVQLQDQYDVLADQYDDLLLDNSKLLEDSSEQLYRIKRLEKHIEYLESYIDNLIKIKMDDHTDEIIKNCNPGRLETKHFTMNDVKVPNELKKKRPDCHQDE